MEQPQEITAALTRDNCRHGFIGGYAVSLDVDLVVDADPVNVRQLLLQVSGFQLTGANSLVFMHNGRAVKVEILRGGHTQQMKLPDAKSVPLHYISARNLPEHDSDTPIPIVHPAVLMLTKVKRWSDIAQSTRPRSIKKAHGDFQDIQVILGWLISNNLRIDFTAYPEKPKESLLPCFRKLCQLHTTVRPLLEVAMEAQDLDRLHN
ncbi:hypothetical protein PENCOP_c008G05304 [Penicillium coprophilum]|uniref:Uncharacterized protein n=1 Tax=Penicillium coprophilum TaxID=36646 RepID=A0A1V6UK98_9EURO|nr:hypothetical protein PENCOP_c008G05304 [Penicillium coprophilum]